MQIIRHKESGEIVYYGHEVDLFTIYHINLKHNFSNKPIEDFEVLDIEDSDKILKIKNNPKSFITQNNELIIEPECCEPHYEANIDKIAQLQCQILSMQKQINDLKVKLNG